MSQSRRLFIGNIPKGTSEDELRAEFGAYGLVESIELKTKPNPLNNAVDTFGFVTIQASDSVINQCIKEFREQKFKGVYLNVSKAKESFLDRLKREREEVGAQKQTAASLDPYKKPAEVESVVVRTKPVLELPTLPTLKKQDESSSSESSESESDEETEAPSSGRAAQFGRPVGRAQEKKPEDDIVRKWNQETYIENGKLKIVPITGQIKEVIDRSTKGHLSRSAEKKLGEQARIADEKRKQGMTKLKSAYDQQKNAIKSALSGESVNNKRKITFSDDEDDGSSKAKLSLFDGQEDEDGFEGNFSVRNQLAGAEGQMLHEMQTAYHADNRFRLDSRFLDRDEQRKAQQKPAGYDKKSEKERRKQMEILSNVTGKTITGERRDESKKRPQMQRYDPSQKGGTDRQKKPEGGDDLPVNKQAERSEEQFKVSEQKFYNVSESLFSSANKNQGFNLLSTFGKATDQHDQEMEAYVEEDEGQDDEMPAKSDAKFKYESSESEEEPQDLDERKDNGAGESRMVEESPERTWMDNVEQRKSGYYSRQGIWKETLFFIPDDTRFEEGRKFFNLNDGSPNGESAEKDANKKKEVVMGIRKIFKKRRAREIKNIRVKSKLGFKIMKKKTFKK